jgi:RNA polymerase sigma-70 factor (ECF subfamily)
MTGNRYEQLNTGELVQLTSAGDKEAFGELVTRYQGHVYGLAYSLVNHWTDAQDIAQEAFIRAYTNIDQLNDPGRFPAWLRRIAFSVTMNWIRSFRPKLYELIGSKVDLDNLEIPDFSPDPYKVVEKRELARAVIRVIDSLPAKYKVPLTMFHLDGLSYSRVADFLDIPLNTVKTLIYRARKKLKKALIVYADEEVAPTVQEVLNEHKLPDGFARKVLDNIPEIRYDKWECTFAGSVKACMDYFNRPVTYDFIMGISGAAFKLMWSPGKG